MVAMKRLFLAAIILSAPLASGQLTPQPSATAYPAHTEHDGAGIGARLLTPGQLQHALRTDLKHCCIVIEVALYPEASAPLQVSPDAFSLHIVGADKIIKPATSRLVADVLHNQARVPRNPEPHGSVGIGYETASGRDPFGNQQRMSGVTTEAQVGVGLGAGPGVAIPDDRERKATELELSGKSLPEGSAAVPVAGYLYFPYRPKKKDKPQYQLEWNSAGQKVILPLPQQ